MTRLVYRQGELFSQEFTQKDYWKACWDWDGPVAGGFCEVDCCIADLADGSGSLYCYMEQCRVLEERTDGRYLVEIAMGTVHGKPWGKDGTKLILSIDEIWAPTRQLRREA